MLQDNSNRRLAHPIYHDLVDEKVSYIFAKEPLLECADKTYLKNVKQLLGEDFQERMEIMAYEASNKIIGWLQVYIDEQGNLEWFPHDSLEIIPLWKNKTKRELRAIIRFYDVKLFNPETKKYNTLQKIEFIDEKETKSWMENLKGGFTLLEPIPHLKQGDMTLQWPMVPFIPFFNNREEIPDIKFIKTLLDAYDATRSESENFIEDIRNFVYVLKGYGGESLDEFMAALRKYKVVNLDEDGELSSVAADMNLDNVKGHYSQLKKDIYEGAQGVLRDISNLGANPTNLALKFLYSGLDLKASKLETQFRAAFKDMVKFINVYLVSKRVNVSNEPVRITFNKDLVMNETEYIQNIRASDTLSLETKLLMHPWVTDVDDELEKLQEEKDELIWARKDIELPHGEAETN